MGSLFDSYQKNITIPIPANANPKLIKRLDQFLDTCMVCARIFVLKNHQYGDSIVVGGVRGAIYEISGIFARLWKLVVLSPDGGDEDHTTIHDLLIDGVNYLIIAFMMMRDGNWLGRFVAEGENYEIHSSDPNQE